jgi:ABC-type transport system involved in multi-copper enzyme maturation permease subunit
MILGIAFNSWRECMRRAFAYLAVVTIVALALVSTLLRPVAFGAGAPEAQNLAISTTLLAALVTAAFLGTALVRADIERGTLLLVMSQPVGLVPYVFGRFLGLFAAMLFVCSLSAAGVLGVLVLFAGGAGEGPLVPAALLRVLFVAPVLSAAALAVSAVTSRLFAPVLLLALFVAGDAAASSPLGRILALYAVFYSVVFLVITYLRLTLRAPIRTES